MHHHHLISEVIRKRFSPLTTTNTKKTRWGLQNLASTSTSWLTLCKGEIHLFPTTFSAKPATITIFVLLLSVSESNIRLKQWIGGTSTSGGPEPKQEKTENKQSQNNSFSCACVDFLKQGRRSRGLVESASLFEQPRDSSACSWVTV